MRFKYALTATAAAVVLTAAGFAQAQQGGTSPSAPAPSAQSPSQPSATGGKGMSSTLHEIKDDKAMITGLNVNAKDLGDMDIYGSDGKKIGEVNKVLADSSNAVKAVTVDVGGFLGMGSHEVVIPIDKLQKGTENKRLQTAMSKDEIQKLDEWSDRDRGNAPQRSGSQGTPPSATTPPSGSTSKP
jgi:sporulation protein YlmC with PRC-barrel domain